VVDAKVNGKDEKKTVKKKPIRIIWPETVVLRPSEMTEFAADWGRYEMPSDVFDALLALKRDNLRLRGVLNGFTQARACATGLIAALEAGNKEGLSSRDLFNLLADRKIAFQDRMVLNPEDHMFQQSRKYDYKSPEKANEADPLPNSSSSSSSCSSSSSSSQLRLPHGVLNGFPIIPPPPQSDSSPPLAPHRVGDNSISTNRDPRRRPTS